MGKGYLLNGTLKNDTKKPKPLWFRGFSNRYLFRFALLVAGKDSRFANSPVSCKRHALATPVCGARKKRGLSLILDFFDRGTRLCLAVSATGGARQRAPTSHARRAHNPETTHSSASLNKNEKRHPVGCLFSFCDVSTKRSVKAGCLH